LLVIVTTVLRYRAACDSVLWGSTVRSAILLTAGLLVHAYLHQK